MKFAFCNEMLGYMPDDQGLAIASRLGYTGVEVAPFTLGVRADEIPSGRIQMYRQLVADYGMTVLGLHWLLAKTQGFHLTTDDVSIRTKTADYLKSLARLCRELGGTVMVLGSPLQRNFQAPMTHAQAADNARGVLERTIPTLEELGVRIAIEPLGPAEGNFLNHASQACELIDALGTPMIQLHLDVKAMSTEGIPIDQIILENRNRMIHFHANDPNLLGPGMGALDQRPIFQALNTIGYTGWVSVEVFDYEPGVETILRESMAHMVAAASH